jgi:AcrR family transcriptional regulator
MATMQRLNRHEQRKAATHQSLLEAAREVIVEMGYNHVDILDITERANVSKATFYQHFPNKEECVRQLMLQGFDALVQQIITEKEVPNLSREEWMLNSFRTLFAWAESNREFLLIMLGGGASHQLNVFGRTYMAEITERLLNDMGYNRVEHPYSATVIAQVITGLLIQLLAWWLEHDTNYSADDMARLVNSVLKNGVGPLI